MAKRKIKNQDDDAASGENEFPLIAAIDLWCSTENAHDREIYERIREMERAKQDVVPPGLAHCIAKYVEKLHVAAQDHASDAQEEFDAQEPREILFIGDYLRLPPESRSKSPLKERLLRFDARRHGGWIGKLDIRKKVAGAPKEKPRSPADHGKEYFGNDGEIVWLDCPADIIPHGLIWLFLKESDGTVSAHLPTLEFNPQKGNWRFRKSFQQLSGHRPKERFPELQLLPATRENREAFLGQEVRDFVMKLNKNSLQRKRAESFLASESEN